VDDAGQRGCVRRAARGGGASRHPPDAGFHGAYLFRADGTKEVEFVTVTLWDSLDAVRTFAGDDYELAVVPPEARRLLSRFDERSRHYETILEPPRA